MRTSLVFAQTVTNINALFISRDSHLPIQLLNLEMECTETSFEWRGDKLEYKETLVKGIEDTSIAKLKARKVSR